MNYRVKSLFSIIMISNIKEILLCKSKMIQIILVLFNTDDIKYQIEK